MAKSYKFEIVIRGAVVLAADGRDRPLRAKNPHLLMVRANNPDHNPVISISPEDVSNAKALRKLSEDSSIGVGPDGRYFLSLSLGNTNKEFAIAGKDGDSGRGIRMEWLAQDLGRQESPTAKNGRQLHSFDFMDWALPCQDLGIKVDEELAVATVSLPSGKLTASSVLRYRSPVVSYRCSVWKVKRGKKLVAEQAIAECYVLTGSLDQPLIVKGADMPVELDPRPRDTLLLSVNNMPPYGVDRDTHLNLYDNISNPRPDGLLSMERRRDADEPTADLQATKSLLHPAGACPPLVYFS